MSEQDRTSTSRQTVAGRFAGDVTHMPLWQKAVLGLAILIGIVGVIGQLTAKPEPAPVVQTDGNPTGVPPGRTFVRGNPQTPAPEPESVAPAPSNRLAEYAPLLTRSGAGFVGAFIIGWAFRVFVKTMVIISLLGVGLLLAGSYYGVLDVDWSVARQHYTSAAGWLWGQASQLKSAALSHLPSTASGVLGLIVGLCRK
jgi:uncharacterized membrane protein (Fun14 family)